MSQHASHREDESQPKHKPDIEKIPKSLRSLDWKEREDLQEFYDGQQLLVAVPVSSGDKPDEFFYEFSFVSIVIDEDFFDVYQTGGDCWCWSLDDIDFFISVG